MNNLLVSVKNIRIFERIFMSLIFISLVLRYISSYNVTVDIVVFCGVLAIYYFPLGGHYIGRPTINGNYLVPILLGFIYSLGITVLFYGTMNIDYYIYPLSVILFLYIIALTFLYIKLKSVTYSMEYVYAQFFRIAFIVLTNIIVFLK
jgi:hypothetical protein